jgi:6-phosphogluconolactonase
MSDETLDAASETRVFLCDDGDAVAATAAEAFVEHLTEVLAQKAEAHVVLTGGTVGIKTLAAIAVADGVQDVDFERIHFWWGDERFVAADSADRNQNQANDALLTKIKLDPAKVHGFASTDSGLSLDEAAAEFAAHVAEFAAVDEIVPEFDVVFLGMGPDGHIASLFPGKPAPKAGVAIIAEHDSPKPPPARLSFTYEALNSAHQVWFVVSGADKAEPVGVAFGDDPSSLPVGRVAGRDATLWFIDEAAAQSILPE